MLESIQTGRENRPPRLMVYGQEGVGKSTLGASAPDAIFIQRIQGGGKRSGGRDKLLHFPQRQRIGQFPSGGAAGRAGSPRNSVLGEERAGPRTF